MLIWSGPNRSRGSTLGGGTIQNAGRPIAPSSNAGRIIGGRGAAMTCERSENVIMMMARFIFADISCSGKSSTDILRR